MSSDIHRMPPEDVLDLHHFDPKEVGQLIEEFIWSCRQAGIKSGVIIHGKGRGNLKEWTHAILRKNKFVKNFHLGGSGKLENWGQTSFSLAHE